jgi:hypothetical protein
LTSRYGRVADASYSKVEQEGLRLSFEFIDWSTKDFFLHGLSEAYYEKLFGCFSTLKQASINSITSQVHPSLAPKFINFKEKNGTATQKSFPESLKQKLALALKKETSDEQDALKKAEETIFQAFEVSLSKQYGRIHGFVHSNVFHIVWFDPAHNLFLGIDRTTGKPRKLKSSDDVATNKTVTPESMHELRDRLTELERENSQLYELLESQTKPASD